VHSCKAKHARLLHLINFDTDNGPAPVSTKNSEWSNGFPPTQSLSKLAYLRHVTFMCATDDGAEVQFCSPAIGQATRTVPLCIPSALSPVIPSSALRASSREMASRIVWVKVGRAKPRPFTGPLDVRPDQLVDFLAEDEVLGNSVRAFSINEWGVHVVLDFATTPTAENEAPFDKTVSSRTGAGDVFIVLHRLPPAAGACSLASPLASVVTVAAAWPRCSKG